MRLQRELMFVVSLACATLPLRSAAQARPSPHSEGSSTADDPLAGDVASRRVTIVPRSLRVTPATVNLTVGDMCEFTVVDERGRPMVGATWSIGDPHVATMAPGSTTSVTAVATGQTTLSVYVQGLSAEPALITVAPPHATVDPGTLVWSATSPDRLPLVQVLQSDTGRDGPPLYVLNGDATRSTVRALEYYGQQVWQVALPPGAQLFPNGYGGFIVTAGCDGVQRYAW